MTHVLMRRDRRKILCFTWGAIAAIAPACWTLPARPQTPTSANIVRERATTEPPSDSGTIDNDTLKQFSNRASRSTVHPDLPGVRPIGFVRDENGQTIPLLSVGGTLRQVPVGEIVANGWRVTGVDRDSVEVSDGSQLLRLPFDRLERSLTAPSAVQSHPDSVPEHDESN
ncbi:MAG: hypothetical protein AAFY15_08395 [Cyanobacteria bacterium J06648_11]